MEELSATHTPIQSYVDALGTPCHVNITTPPEAATTMVLIEHAKTSRERRGCAGIVMTVARPATTCSRTDSKRNATRSSARTMHNVLQQPSRHRNAQRDAAADVLPGGALGSSRNRDWQRNHGSAERRRTLPVVARSSRTTEGQGARMCHTAPAEARG
jgi:hypothetical protein